MTCQILRNDGLECREDDPWDVFIPDDDECDPNPEPGDFWSDEDLPFTDGGRYGDLVCARGREVSPCSH
jgi:hypothetical protein